MWVRFPSPPPMRCLVYAFGAFGRTKRNISEEVLEGINLGCDKRVLRVRWGTAVYRRMVGERWDKIVGLGQYPRGNKIRIERFAHNSYGTRARGYRAIDKLGPRELRVDLDFEPVEGAVVTEEAGRYVCNYSMYQLMRLKSEDTKFGFLHIPRPMRIDRVLGVVERLLEQVGVQ